MSWVCEEWSVWDWVSIGICVLVVAGVLWYIWEL